MEAVWILAWCQFPCLFVFFISPYSVCLFGVFIFFGFSLVHGSCLDILYTIFQLILILQASLHATMVLQSYFHIG